ncbi:hypothetical protein [Bryobacter aggregatus]|uniref:hypothetical protein n=1 Tax=Bryobacter aggregatus TaxID=360054 RepID=UPI0012BAB9F6|nr:hypothetical protein [Bryobacter aggregatus]
MKKMMILAASLAYGQHGHDSHGKEMTMTGLVVDTGCYLSHDTKGEKHVACATACAKAGVPLALLDEASGTLYIPVAADHKNQNERLMPFIEKKVKVSGTLVEKGGVKGFVIKSVEAAK